METRAHSRHAVRALAFPRSRSIVIVAEHRLQRVSQRDEEGVDAGIELPLGVAQAVVRLEEEQHRRRDALEHEHNLLQVLLRVAPDLRAVGGGVALLEA